MMKMKDSGVEWIGKIPEDWEITAIKNYCVNVFAGGTPQSNNEEYWGGDIPWIPSGSCHDCKITNATKFITEIGFENSSTKMIPANTALVAMTGATCGNTGFLTFDSCANQSVTAYVAKDSTYSLFIWYLLQAAKEHLLTFQTGGAQGGVNVSNCKNILVPYLNYSVQKRLADYLDEKCTKIDGIIKKQQAVIEKLKEYKLSVITEAVTKGLNQDVEMRDSGIEFIGFIPASWTTNKLKFMSLEIGDGLHGTPEYDTEGNIYFVNGNNIGEKSLVFKSGTNTINDAEFQKYKEPLLNDNTILMTLNGATYGKTSFYNGEKILLGKSAGYITLKNDENKEFVRYYLQSKTAKLIMDYSLCGSTIANVSLRTLNDFSIPYPSKGEQSEIVAYLDKHTTQIDYSINCRKKIIEKLVEYKKSLIYEVVTGKKEV